MAVARLKVRADFLRIAGLRRKWATPGLILQAAPQPKPEPTPMGASEPAVLPGIRVGFTCSKKVGNAVARNRARRRLREAAERILPLHAQPGMDYVLIGRTESVGRPFHLLLQDLTQALKRLGAYRSSGDGA